MSMVDERLLRAIAMAESSNNPKAVGDRNLPGQAHGRYQMRPIAYKDVQRLNPKEFGHIAFEKMASDQALQRRAAEKYLQALEGPYGAIDLDHLISAYNAGPSTAKGTITNMDYVNKVKLFLNQEAPMPASRTPKPQSALPQEEGDPIERGVRRMNDFMVAMGMRSMTSQEIEPILRKVTPRKAIRGIKPPESQAVPDFAIEGGLINDQSQRFGVR